MRRAGSIQISVFASALLCVATVACTPGASATAGRPVVRLATGSQGFPEAYAELMPDVSFTVVASSGSITQLEALQAGTADVGTAIADVTYLAYQGQLGEHPGPFTKLRGMAVLQPTAVQVMVAPNSRLTSVAQFRGARVAVGAKGSETAVASRLVLGAFGLTLKDVRTASLSFTDAARQLIRGDLDAAFFNGGYPVDSVAVAARAGARLLPIVGPEVDRLRREYPFLRKTIVPERVYLNHDEAVHTIGIDNILVCRADLDEALVYRLTKVLLEAMPYPAARIASFSHLDLMRMPATPVPLHLGAARYYRERELFR